MVRCPSQAFDDYLAGQEGPCEVCRRSIDDCDCPECPRCAAVGDPSCYASFHLPQPADSIAAFVGHIGVANGLAYTLRAIDKHNTEHVYLVLHDGSRLYYDSDELDAIPVCTRIARLGTAGIAWDSTDWEFCEETPAGDWAALDQARRNFEDALEEHNAQEEEE